MSDSTSFSREMLKLAGGDQEAAAAFFDRYAQRLIGLARGRLNDRLRNKVDPDDVMQSVFRTFLRRHQDRGFELNNWDGLWALLAEITCRKCGRHWEYFSAEKRDVQRDVEPAGADSVTPWDPAAAEPTPEEAAALMEQIEMLFRDRTPRAREILEMRLQGYTVPEIAKNVGCTERTVFRHLNEIRGDLEHWLDRSDSIP